jgi:hypothetical protein
MAIIIGSNTIVSGPSFPLGGIISVQWGIQPQLNRLWELGNWRPWKTVVTRVTSLSLTTYAGAGPSINLAPANSCVDSSAKLIVTIAPGSCGTIPGGLGGTFTVYLNSYSYSKGDPIGFGQQSYSGQYWPGPAQGGPNDPVLYNGAPTLVLQGTAEGTQTADSGLVTGITFDTSPSNPLIEGQEGSVSAGFPGVGQADTVTYGIVNSVTNGDLVSSGKVGQASVNIPHQPLYFG